MNKLTLSHHARDRMRQRGYHDSDLDLILAYGEPVRDGNFMTHRAADDAIREHRFAIHNLERLKRKRAFAVIQSDTVVTMQCAKPWKQRRLLADK